jgi:putative heme iron utilization protein
MSEKAKSIIRETDAEAIRLARTLMRSARFGALAVIDAETSRPHVSRVGTATDLDGTPIILVSALAPHTAALFADKRCSLLLGEPGKGDPLAHPRITLFCNARAITRDMPSHERVARRYLNRQPKAKLYAGFADFTFFRLEPEGASLNGGFGKAYMLTPGDLVRPNPVDPGLDAMEEGVLAHMNTDHREAVALYARHFAGAPGGAWIMTGIDADGFDLACNDDVRRVFFDRPLEDETDIRNVLVAMADEARQALSPAAASSKS